MKKGDRVTLTEGWLKHSIGDQYPEFGTHGTVLNSRVRPEEVEAVTLVGLLGKTGNLMLVRWDDGSENYVREPHVAKGEVEVKVNPIKVGDSVVFTDAVNRERFPNFYPPVGTEGKVISVVTDDEVRVQWPKGTTSDEDKWFAMNRMLLRKSEQNAST